MGKAGTKGVARADREAQIIDIAAYEVARVGYSGLSLATVAESAGVSKPLIYTYFGTKDGLFAACVDRAAAPLIDAIEEVIGGDATLAMAENTLAAIFAVLEPRPHGWKVIFDFTHPSEGPAADAAHRARSRIADQAARGAAAFLARRGITNPVDQSAMTTVWMGMVASLVDWWLRHPDNDAQSMTAIGTRLLTALTK